MSDVKKLAGISTGLDIKAAVRIPHTRATKKGELVHCGLAGGGLLPTTLGRARYIAAMTGNYTDFTTVHP